MLRIFGNEFSFFVSWVRRRGVGEVGGTRIIIV